MTATAVKFAVGYPWKSFIYDLTDKEVTDPDLLEKIQTMLFPGFCAPSSVDGWDVCLGDQIEWLKTNTRPGAAEQRAPMARIWLIKQALIALGEHREELWLQNQCSPNVCIDVMVLCNRLYANSMI